MGACWLVCQGSLSVCANTCEQMDLQRYFKYPGSHAKSAAVSICKNGDKIGRLVTKPGSS